MTRSSITIRIAGIVVSVKSPVAVTRFNDFGFYRDFMTASAGTPACRLRLTIGPPPDLPRAGESFSLENWQLLQAGPENILRVGPPPKRGRPDNIVVFNADYSEGAMYQNMVFELFRRFIDQFLFINLLSQRDGFLLHASGVAWEGKGLAFIGRSGAGK